MRCPKCHGNMEPNSAASKDNSQIHTTWLCPACLYRFATHEVNPRFQAFEAAVSNNKDRKSPHSRRDWDQEE